MSRPQPRAGPQCATCIHFEQDPAKIEAELPGLTILSSAYGSARGDADLCSKHDLWISAREICADYRDSRSSGS